MAHYAFLDENNIVTEVIPGRNENDPVPNGFDSWEAYYGNVKGKTCKRTSYNTHRKAHALGGTPFRGTYPAKGFIWDSDNEIFKPVKPYASWTWNNTAYRWDAPTNPPETTTDVDGVDVPDFYEWDEINQTWNKQPTDYPSL